MPFAPRRPRAAVALLSLAVLAVLSLGLSADARAQSPTITSVTPPALPGLGGVRITISGSDFGGNGGTVSIQGREVEVPSGSDWAPSRVLVTVPAGDPGPAPIFVRRADGAQSPEDGSAFYQPPQVFSLTPGSGPSRGGTLITLMGVNFGTGTASSAVHFGPIEVPMIYVSPTEARATTPPLPPGSLHEVGLVINGQPSNLQPFMVEPPAIASITPHFGPGNGSVIITIFGENFGEAFHPLPVVKVGGIVSPSVTRIHQGEILAQSPPGAGVDKPLVVQVGSAESAPSAELFSYLPPVITGVSPPSAPAMGGAHITITGANFGPPGTARELHLQPLGGGLVINGTINGPEADDMLVADLPPVPPGSYAVMLLVEGQPSNPGFYEATGVPTIAGAFPASAPTEGGLRLTITGANFGADGGTVVVQGRSMPVAPGPDWTPEQILLDLPEGDPGPAPLRVLTAKGTPSEIFDGFAYNPPVVFNASPPIVPAAGGVVLTVIGQNFGTPEAIRTARMGGKIALCQRLSHQVLTVEAPSLPPGAIVPLEIEIGGFPVAPIPVSVLPPMITAIDPATGPTAGGIPITIHGANFGTSPDDPEPVVRLQTPRSGSTVTRVSDGVIEVILGEGAGAGHPVEVEVGGVTSAPGPQLFSYLPPSIAGVDPPAAPAAGGFPITIVGANFGPEGSRGEIALFDALGGSIPVPLDPASSGFSQLVGILPPLAPGTYSVRVTVAGQASNDHPYEALASAPVISMLSTASGPTQGNIPITVIGQDFGPAPGLLLFGELPAAIDEWNDGAILARTPEAWSGTFPVTVHRAGGSASNALEYVYEPPHINGVFPVPLDPAGGQVITIVGVNFGREDAPRVVFIAGQPVMQLAWLGHHQVTVLSPPGTPGTLASLCIDIDGAIATCTQVEYGSAVDVAPVHLPAAFDLRLAGANPSRGVAAFAIDLPRDARWRLRIFDPAGRVVRSYEADAAAGVSMVRWDGADTRGVRARAGLYWARLEVAGETFVRKVVRL